MKSLAKATSTAADAATTAALFSLQHHAEAAVVYSGLQNETASIVGNASSFKPIPGIGLELVVGRSGMFGFNNAGIYAPSGRGFVLRGSQGLKKLGSGVAITAVPHNAVSGNMVFYQRTVRASGSWNKSQTGFAAFQMANGDLGWVRLEWTPTSGGTGPSNLTALDWAYENSGGPITTPFENAPEPSRALLALAGLGALALRRRRKKE